MIASTLTSFLKRLGSLAGPDADALTPPLGEELAFDATDIFVQFRKPAADAMASTAAVSQKGYLAADVLQGGFQNPFDFDLMVMGFTISPNAALTADAANFATIAVETDDAADGAPAAAISVATTIALPGSGTWATDVPQIINIGMGGTKGILNAAGQRLRPGANLFMSIAKSGTGVVVPVCAFSVRLRRL